jgi:hypothetical protein
MFCTCFNHICLVSFLSVAFSGRHTILAEAAIRLVLGHFSLSNFDAPKRSSEGRAFCIGGENVTIHIVSSFLLYQLLHISSISQCVFVSFSSLLTFANKLIFCACSSGAWALQPRPANCRHSFEREAYTLVHRRSHIVVKGHVLSQLHSASPFIGYGSVVVVFPSLSSPWLSLFEFRFHSSTLVSRFASCHRPTVVAQHTPPSDTPITRSIISLTLTMDTAQLQQQQQQMWAQMQQRIQQLESALAAQRAAPAAEQQASSAPHKHSNVKPMSPPPFTGALLLGRTSPEQWLMEMERYLTVGEAEQTKWVPIAATYLKEGAGTWFNSLPDQERNGTWDAFKVLFRARFQPFEASRMARAALRRLQQRGRVAAYCELFLKQVQHIPDMATADQLDAFINGLHDRLRDAVDRERPTTLTDAMNAAQREELRQATRRGNNTRSFYPPLSRHMSAHHGSLEGDAMDLSYLEEDAALDHLYWAGDRAEQSHVQQHLCSMYSDTRRVGPSLQRPRSTKRVDGLTYEEYEKDRRANRCFNCKETGHVARFCNKPRRTSASNSSN